MIRYLVLGPNGANLLGDTGLAPLIPRGMRIDRVGLYGYEVWSLTAPPGVRPEVQGRIMRVLVNVLTARYPGAQICASLECVREVLGR